MVKFALWIDMRSSIDNTLHGSGREMHEGILLQIENHPRLVVLILHVMCLASKTQRHRSWRYFND